ncbi:polysaccharide deacetylase family protein [Leucobacter sp. W1153]|uniref:polysaccharide deacetylase family protein n=1 Tax=Leucobacter sp. W1153 TaxID=3439064 RepID=UPI003F2EDC7F
MSGTVIFTFDVDADSVWVGEDPEAAKHPVSLSQGEYEVRRGLDLVLLALRDYGVTASFYVPGVVAEQHPQLVERILADEHEVAHHGYTHRAPAGLSLEEEREEMERSIASLRRFGIEPRGYRAASWDVSRTTLHLAHEHGFVYSSNLMADIEPYLHESGLVELPVHWNLDDAAHFWFAGDDTWLRKLMTNRESNELFDAEADGIEELGGTCVYTFHPQIIGRPGRLPVLRHALERATGGATTRIRTAEVAVQEFLATAAPQSETNS